MLNQKKRPDETFNAVPESIRPHGLVSDNVDFSLLLETMKAMRSELSQVRVDVSDIKIDMRGLKAHMAGYLQSEIAQDSQIASLQARMDRIERRLDLVD